MSLRDQLRFLARLAADPGHVGAIAPSSKRLARAMAAQSDPVAGGRVLELGPGTGVVTEALIARGFTPERITAVEFDAGFAKDLRRRLPGVNVIAGDAFALTDMLGEARFAAIVSSLPLLNFPPDRRRIFVADVLERLEPGAPYVQFSYGFKPPVAPPAGAYVGLAALVWRNLPPARVWVYRRY